jgi:predicted nucleic acid-binding protein
VTPVLVDTSVWRHFFMGAAATRPLLSLLEEDGAVLTHPWVLGELLLGGLSKSEERLMERLPMSALVSHAEVVELIRQDHLIRKGVGWVDVNLLASALAGSGSLWTLDRHLARIAVALEVDFVPSLQ